MLRKYFTFPSLLILNTPSMVSMVLAIFSSVPTGGVDYTRIGSNKEIPTTFASSTWNKAYTLSLPSPLINRQGSEWHCLNPKVFISSDSLQFQARAACLSPYPALSSFHIFPFSPTPGGALMYTSSSNSPCKNAVDTSSW